MSDDQHLRFDRTLTEEKRVETGSYYTPPAMAELMVVMALAYTLHRKLGTGTPEDFMRLLSDENPKAVSIGSEKEQTKLHKRIHETLGSMDVLDLSAGSGIFPLTYMKVLKRWYEAFGLWKKPLIAAVAGRLTLVDIQPEPLQLFEEEFKFLYGATIPMPSIHALDALDEAAVSKHPDLELKLASGVDLVLGNPPYLGEKNHKDIFQKLRATPFGARFYEGRMDYFYYFIYRGLEALRPGGQLCFITTNYFATADGAKNLRKHLAETARFNLLINFNDCAMFKDALGQHNIVFNIEKGVEQEENCLLAYPKHKAASLTLLYDGLLQSKADLVEIINDDWQLSLVNRAMLYDYQGMLKIVPSEAHQQLIMKLRHEGLAERKTLGDQFYVQQGIVSGFDRDFKEKQGVFVLTNEEAEARPWLKSHLKPFYKNKQVRKYQVVKPTDYEVLYLSSKMEEMELEEGPVFEHLAPYRKRLANRREVVKNIRPWYALQWPREPWRFQGPLIAAPQRAFVNVFAYEAEELYGSADIYYIADKMQDQWVTQRTLWTLAYLNSPLVYFWLSLMGKRKGSMLELYATPLKSIPLPIFKPANNAHNDVVKWVEALLTLEFKNPESKTQREQLLDLIHERLYDEFGLTVPEREHIQLYYQNSGAKDNEAHYWMDEQVV